jgi:predicted nuclease with TOPRIM domain
MGMREQIERRLEELKGEFEAGQKMLAEIEQRKLNLEQTLLRISGAIQVLEEMLTNEQPSVNGAAPIVHNEQV